SISSSFGANFRRSTIQHASCSSRVITPRIPLFAHEAIEKNRGRQKFSVNSRAVRADASTTVLPCAPRLWVPSPAPQAPQRDELARGGALQPRTSLPDGARAVPAGHPRE